MRNLSKRDLSKRQLGCDGCAHWRQTYDKGLGNHGEKACHYLLDEGHARGCPAGEGCTEYRKALPGEVVKHNLDDICIEFEVGEPIELGSLLPNFKFEEAEE